MQVERSPLYIDFSALALRSSQSDISVIVLTLQCNNGSTPLYIASHNGHTEIVSILIKANANPNLYLDDGATPLYIASQNGHTDINSLLLKANADPNLQCDNGAIPLYIASQKGHTDTISLLLKANADPNLQLTMVPHLSSLQVRTVTLTSFLYS